MRIIAPTNCPTCDSVLEFKKDILYCLNNNCPARTSKRLENFCKVMKIKGLGPATLSKLDISSIPELYALSEDDIRGALGSEKIATKLISELHNSTAMPLNVVLPAMSIPLIGASVTGKLASSIAHLDEVNADTLKSAGVGPKASSNLLEWLKLEYIPNYKDVLPFSFEFERSAKPTQKLKGVVCITGKLKSFKSKAVAKDVLEAAGYEVKSSITKAVTILVNESGIESAKVTKARESGITIVDNINELIGD